VQPLSTAEHRTAEALDGTNFSYKARFEVRPEIASVKYDGFEVKRPSGAVTDAMNRRRARGTPKGPCDGIAPAESRPSKKATSSRSPSTSMAEKRVPEASGDDFSRARGGQISAQLDEGLLGVSAGESKDIELTFPANHARPFPRENLRSFTSKVKEVKERVLAALDDDFAKDVGTFQTLAKLKEDIKKKLETAPQAKGRGRGRRAALAKLSRRTRFRAPRAWSNSSAADGAGNQPASPPSGQAVPSHDELHARVPC